MPALARQIPAAQPETLIGFLRKRGGLRDCTELRRRDADRQWPGPVKQTKGFSLDYAREAAAEAGFLGADVDAAMAGTDINDFLAALDAHPCYRASDGDRLVSWQAQSVAKAFTQSLADLICELETAADDYGMTCDVRTLQIAAQLVLENPGMSYDDALKRALIAAPEPVARFPTALKIARTAPAQSILPQCERARSWRTALGLSRTELAERVGFSVSQIQDYEEGKRRGKTGTAAIISPAAWQRYTLACSAMAAKLQACF